MGNQMEIPEELERPVRELVAQFRDLKREVETSRRIETDAIEELEKFRSSSTRPCSICGTNCSGCLEDLAAKQEGLRELLSYCQTLSTDENLDEAEQLAYDDVVIRLAPLLDGEA